MAITSHGNTLAIPVLKPNSTRFTLTREGFDTGTRTFIIDRSQVEDAIPALDTSDRDIQWRDRSGNQQGTYRRMYVSHVSDITELTNNICEYSVSYLGLIQDTKRPFITSQTATGAIRATFGTDDDGPQGRIFESAPVVTVVRVTTTKPNPSQLGTVMVPPGWPSKLNTVKIKGVIYPALNAEFWSLRERDYEQCGPIYEVREQYVYDRIRV